MWQNVETFNYFSIRYLCRKPFDDEAQFNETKYEKLTYVRRQMMAELGLSHWRSREFWIMLTMFVLVFFVRLYIHYLGQWIFLQARKKPITKYVHHLHTCGQHSQVWPICSL